MTPILALVASLLLGCNTLWDLDELRYETDTLDPAPGTGLRGQGGGTSMSASATGGTGVATTSVVTATVGTGGGGATGTPVGPFTNGCGGDGTGDEHDHVALAPLTLASEGARQDLSIAALSDVYGVVRYSDSDNDALVFTLVGHDGAVVDSHTISPVAPSRLTATVAASDSMFAIPVIDADESFPYVVTRQDVYLFSPDSARPLQVIDVGAAGASPLHTLVTGGQDGFLVTYLRNFDLRSHSLSHELELGEEHWVKPQNQSVAERWWTAGQFRDGRYASISANGYSDARKGEYTPFDANAVPSVADTALGYDFENPPRFAERVGEHLYFGNCYVGALATASDVELVPFAAGLLSAACGMASTGESLRVAELGNGVLTWSRLDPATGQKTELLTVPAAANSVPEDTSAPEVTWDGSGFGIVWRYLDTLQFARIEVCEEH